MQEGHIRWQHVEPPPALHLSLCPVGTRVLQNDQPAPLWAALHRALLVHLTVLLAFFLSIVEPQRRHGERHGKLEHIVIVSLEDAAFHHRLHHNPWIGCGVRALVADCVLRKPLHGGCRILTPLWHLAPFAWNVVVSADAGSIDAHSRSVSRMHDGIQGAKHHHHHGLPHNSAPTARRTRRRPKT